MTVVKRGAVSVPSSQNPIDGFGMHKALDPLRVQDPQALWPVPRWPSPAYQRGLIKNQLL